MFRWFVFAGFLVSSVLVVTLAAIMFLIAPQDLRRSALLESNKDCFGPPVPKELEQLKIYGSPVTSVLAASSPHMSKRAMIDVGRQASVRFPEKIIPHTSAIAPSDSGRMKDVYLDHAFVSFNITRDGHYRIGGHRGVDIVKLSNFISPDRYMSPIHEGRIACELDFVSDFILIEGKYIARIVSQKPAAYSDKRDRQATTVRLIVTPVETVWDKRWDRRPSPPRVKPS